MAKGVIHAPDLPRDLVTGDVFEYDGAEWEVTEVFTTEICGVEANRTYAAKPYEPGGSLNVLCKFCGKPIYQTAPLAQNHWAHRDFGEWCATAKPAR